MTTIMTTTALAIFVKTPNVSPLKTRLAATIGTPKSLEFYSLSLNAVQSSVQNSDVTPYWAVGEASELQNPLWQAFPTIHSRDGDLGDRQHHIYSTLLKKHDNVILIGADTPQITANIINTAIKNLKTNPFTIGPATDGGYYLFGGNKPLDKPFWKSIPWSADNTRSTLISKLPTSATELAPLTDVDTEADLQAILQQMPTSKNPAQTALINWIKNQH